MQLRQLTRFLQAEEGTTAVEYCVMLGMILLAVIVAIMATGSGVAGWWSNIDSDLQSNGF
jgi:Flp pilus assembly pilin Flp